MIKVHHLNCGSLCPFGRLWLNGDGHWSERAQLCCHCLLIETGHGLVLVDTGLGRKDLHQPYMRLGILSHLALAPEDRPELTAIAQIEALGFSARDVRHILLTHLDLDHAGGLSDFPEAEVHIHRSEWQAAMHPSLHDRGRYRAPQWAHRPRWTLHETGGDRWRGLQSIQAIPGTNDQILLIPLHGHTHGHCGIAVDCGSGWLLHAGDAYFHRDELQTPAQCPVGLDILQRLMQTDSQARLHNQARLRQLNALHQDLKIFCAHDTFELRQAQHGPQPD